MAYNLTNDLFNDLFTNFTGYTYNNVMHTNIYKTKDGNYSLHIEMPGFKKSDIKLSLYNGNLKITASHNETQEEKDEKGALIHSEIVNQTVSRSYYVGTAIKDTDLHASYDNGILKVTFPSAEKKEVETTKYIEID